MSLVFGLIASILFIAGCIAFFWPIRALKITTKIRASGLVLLGLFIGLTVTTLDEMKRAEELGFASVTELHEAEKAEKQKAEAEKAAAAAEKTAAEAEAKKIEEARLVAEQAEEMRKGFHCLSSWDGSYPELERFVEERLVDPDSYEHIKTLIAPVSDVGTHDVAMQYRARNGFGGMTIGTATAVITNDGCKLVTASVE